MSSTDELVVTPSAGGEFELHEEYTPYPGTLVRIEAETGEYGDTFKWVIVLDQDKGKRDDGSDRETFAWTSRKISSHEKSKGGQFYKGVMRQPVVDGEPIDLRELFGKRVNVLFEHVTKKDGTAGDKVFALKAE